MITAYQRWAAQPGNLERKAAYHREVYKYKKSLGLCVKSCCKNNAEPGRATCLSHGKP